MTDNARKSGAAIEAHFQFLMWLVPAIGEFPRSQRFLPGPAPIRLLVAYLRSAVQASN
jgi:hypothetical protein